MKKYKLYLVILILLSIPLIVYARNLRVKITGIEKTHGNIVIALYDSYRTFMKTPCLVQKTKVESKVIVLDFDIIDGVYAISVFHDENLNNKLDTGLFGVPLEKYGFSNNAKGFAGAPSFKSASFKVNGKTELIIKLQ